MDKNRQWILTVSAISIISGILLYIVPESSQKNIFKVVTSVILIYAVIQPIISFKGVDFNLEDYLTDNYQVSENLDRYAVDTMKKSAEKTIETLLSEKSAEQGLDCSFECKCTITDDRLEVENITIKLLNNDNSQEKIINICTALGFKESVLIFEGGINE